MSLTLSNSLVSRRNHDLIGFGGRDKFQIASWKIPRRDGHIRIATLRNRNVVFAHGSMMILGCLKGVQGGCHATARLRQRSLFPSAEAFQNHDDFDAACCVILDINLNKESGIDLRHRLKAAGISLPVIYITGNDNPAVRMAAIESGCIAYLTKPFGAKSLIEPIERVMAGAA